MLFFFVFYKGSFNFSIGFCKVIGYIDFLYRNFEILKNSFFFLRNIRIIKRSCVLHEVWYLMFALRPWWKLFSLCLRPLTFPYGFYDTVNFQDSYSYRLGRLECWRRNLRLRTRDWRTTFASTCWSWNKTVCSSIVSPFRLPSNRLEFPAQSIYDKKYTL